MDKHAQCSEGGCQAKEAKGYLDCEQHSGCCALLPCPPEVQLRNTARIALTKLDALEAFLPHTPAGDDVAGGCNAIRVVLNEVIKAPAPEAAPPIINLRGQFGRLFAPRFTAAAITINVDQNLPGHTAEFRDYFGNVLARIINIDGASGPQRSTPE